MLTNKLVEPEIALGRGLVMVESEANTSQLRHGEGGHAQLVIPGCDPPTTYHLANKTFGGVPLQYSHGLKTSVLFLLDLDGMVAHELLVLNFARSQSAS